VTLIRQKMVLDAVLARGRGWDVGLLSEEVIEGASCWFRSEKPPKRGENKNDINKKKRGGVKSKRAAGGVCCGRGGRF